MKRITLFLFVATVFIPFWALAQSALPKKYPTPKKVKVLYDFPKEGRTGKNGKGFSASLSQLPQDIKKVGLVSFFVFDPGVTKTWSTTSESATMVTTTHYTKKRSTGGLSGDICVGALNAAYEPMKSVFKSNGMELLLPDEFCDTKEKETSYQAFKVDHEKLADWFNNMGSGNHDVMYGVPEGMIVADIVKEPYVNYSMSGMFAVRKDVVADNQVYIFDKDTRMTESLGNQLCKEMGLDAVLVSYMTIFAPNNKNIKLQNVRLVMFGPNPNPPSDGKPKHGIIPHVNGLFYVGTSVNPECLIFNPDKKDPSTQNFDFTGFDNIYSAMTTSMCAYIQKARSK